MTIKTHEAIDRRLCGEPLEVAADRAIVRLQTLPEMATDDRGLVHGGFVFGLADYAAMLAINHPHVVLGSAEARFLAPVTVGEAVTALATAAAGTGRKRAVEVVAHVGDREVFRGTFTTVTLDRHVLDGRPPA